MKELKNYLHLYIGCECIIGDLNWKPETNLHGLAPGVDPNFGKPIRTILDAHALNVYSHMITLLLRPLSDMTEEEEKEMLATQDNVKLHGYPEILLKADSGETFLYMLSKGFDLFGLIDSGLAVSKTETKN